MRLVKHRLLSRLLAMGTVLLLIGLINTRTASAAKSYEIDIDVEATLKRFVHEVPVGSDLLAISKGVLVFPNVIKGGFFIGGEYGEGALQIDGEIFEYYSLISASVGFQMGAQSRSIVILFLSQPALNGFMNSGGWKVGVDGNITLIKWGEEKNVDSLNLRDPVVAFIFGNKGLMYNLTLEGSKISRISRD